MRAKLLAAVALTLGVTFLPAPAAAGLREDVQARLSAAGGRWGVVVHDLGRRGEVVLRIDADATFEAASSMKILILAKILRDVRDGRYALSTPVAVHDRFRSAAGGKPFRVAAREAALRQRIGATATVEELALWMMRRSDNLASNLLMDQAGGIAAVDSYARGLGLTRSRTRRYLLDRPAMRAGLTNVASPGEYCELLVRAQRGELEDPEISRQLLAFMGEVGRGWMGRGLPRTARIAHKTGRLPGVRNDVALVSADGSARFALCIMSGDVEDGRGGEAAIGDLARIVWAHLVRRPAR